MTLVLLFLYNVYHSQYGFWQSLKDQSKESTKQLMEYIFWGFVLLLTQGVLSDYWFCEWGGVCAVQRDWL